MNPNPLPRISLKFARYKIAQLIVGGRHIVTMLTGNPKFPTTAPTLAAVTAVLDTLEAAQDAALGGDRVAISALKDAKVTTIATLRQLSTSVQNQAEGDRTALLSSGFELNKVPAPIGPLPPPGAPKLTRGKNDGEIKARVTKPNGTKSVNWRIALASAPTVYLEMASSSKGSYLFTRLTAGQIYLVQASLVGTSNTTSWGPTSALMAL
jgi:hypothetical protein